MDRSRLEASSLSSTLDRTSLRSKHHNNRQIQKARSHTHLDHILHVHVSHQTHSTLSVTGNRARLGFTINNHSHTIGK